MTNTRQPSWMNRRPHERVQLDVERRSTTDRATADRWEAEAREAGTFVRRSERQTRVRRGVALSRYTFTVVTRTK